MSTPGDDPSLTSLEPSLGEDPDTGWSHPGHGTLALAILGRAPGSETALAIYVELNQFESFLALDEFVAWVGEKLSKTRNVRIEKGPRPFKQDVLSLVNNSPGGDPDTPPTVLQPFRRDLGARENLERLHEYRVNDEYGRMEAFLVEKLEDRCFSDGCLDVQVRIGAPSKQADKSGSENSNGEGNGGVAKRFLPVLPVVDPLRGVPLGDLCPGDRMEVRVHGDATRKLQEQYRSDEEGEDGEERSRPFTAQLERVGPYDSENNEVEFLVRLTADLEGRGQIHPRTRVLTPERTVEALTDRARVVLLYTSAGVLVFLFSASLLLLVFPDLLRVLF